MKITAECKERFLEIFKENNVDTIIISTQENSCHGFVMNLELGKKETLERVIDVDGINVSISQEDEELLNDLIFDIDGEQIAIIKENCDCCGEHKCNCHDDCCCDHEDSECDCCHDCK